MKDCNNASIGLHASNVAIAFPATEGLKEVKKDASLAAKVAIAFSATEGLNKKSDAFWDYFLKQKFETSLVRASLFF